MKLSPLILALATSVIVDAGPVGIRDIPTLAKQVDGIVVGTISSNTQSGTISILEVSVNRVLKGAFVPQQIISVQWTFSQARSLQPTVKGVTGLWFLKGNAASAFWVVEPPYGGDIQVPHLFLPASTTIASDDFKYSAGASARDKVLMELLNFIETHPGSNLSMVFDVADRGDLAAAEKVYARWSNDTKQPTLQIQGIAGLLRHGSPAGLFALESNLKQVASTPAAALLWGPLRQYNNANPQGIAILGRIASSSGITSAPWIPSCGVEALRAIHTAPTLPFLFSFLDSTDQNIRYAAVSGMASFANSGNVPRESPLLLDGVPLQRSASGFATEETLRNFPTLESFARNEATYIAFWKAWWTKSRGSLGM